MIWKYKYSAATNIGRRKVNQDNFTADGNSPYYSDRQEKISIRGTGKTDGVHFFGVFDGVGAGVNSANASRISAEHFAEKNGSELSEDRDDFQKYFAEEFDSINGEIEDASEREFEAMTTASVLLIIDDNYYYANIGDSPAFLVREDTITELSVRQNEGYNKIRYNTKNNLSEDDKEYKVIKKSDFSQIMFFLGFSDPAPSEVFHFESGKIQSGDTFIICSDGVTKVFTEDELKFAAKAKIPAKLLADASAYNVTSDNCTCIMVNIK